MEKVRIIVEDIDTKESVSILVNKKRDMSLFDMAEKIQQEFSEYNLSDDPNKEYDPYYYK